MELRSRKKGSGPGSSSAGSKKGKEICISSSSDSDSLSDGTSDESSDDSFLDEVVIDDSDCSSDDGTGVVDEEKAPKRRREKSKSNADAMVLDAEEAPVAEQAELDQSLLADFLKRIYNKRRRRGRRNSKSKEILLWEIWEQENDEWIDENLTLDTDLDSQSPFAVETADAPSDFIIPLLRYQKEWLAWALKQEGSEIKGGILADEMGMGKTAQAIALVLAERQLLMGESTSSGSSSNLSGSKTTLVVCPVVAVSQWVSEVDRFTLKGSTSVLVYHGATRERDIEQFSKYDFVITTYSTIEAEFRKCVMPPKKTCDYCGKKFNEDKLAFHLKYFCGPGATRTVKQCKQQRKKGNFVKEQVAKNDKNGVDDKANNSSRKRARTKSNNENDSFQSNVSLKEKSVLHSVKWKRIILDEAHYIKDRRSNTAKAIFALESSYKWALSGTPLQNRVGELYSLIRFLQVVPYSFYLCKDCNCRTLDHRTSTVCSSCPHNAVRHFCWWNRYITNPVQASANSEDGRRAMILLRHKVLKNILLRRTKEGRAADLALPPRIVSLRRDTLDVKEDDYYESLYNESQAMFNTYVNAGTVMNNYAHIFDLLTRLRQAVDHPYLVVYSKRNDPNSGNSNEFNDVEQDCGICHEPLEDRVVTSCAHVFCKACLLSYASSLGQVSCPSCSKLLTVDWTADPEDRSSRSTIKGFSASSILNRLQLSNFQTSTKIEALREEIKFMLERDGSAKGIVFSQFTQFLDLIGYCLQKSGISCVQLVGSMSFGARVAAIKKFNEDPDCKIFLIGLKAGGVALNLTIASHVFMMDPWWNPAVERQAQDRIHRIGQFKPIRIVRFVIENTVEERILHLQQKKELVFEGTVGGSSKALGKLTEADMRFLFAS